MRSFMPVILAVSFAAPSHLARAQDALDAKSVAHLRTQYANDLDTVHVKILALANAIPAEKYTWRPAPGVRSISEVLMHCAGEWYYYVPGSVGKKPPADFGVPKEALPKLEKTTAKADVIAQLNKSWAHSKTELAAADPTTLTGKYKPWGITFDQAAFSMSGDMHEHLGQLITYARSIGVKPPWSK